LILRDLNAMSLELAVIVAFLLALAPTLFAHLRSLKNENYFRDNKKIFCFNHFVLVPRCSQ
jgi:hypothetical protein